MTTTDIDETVTGTWSGTGKKTLTGTVDAYVNHTTGMVTNLKPSSSSGSTAMIVSGKTAVLTWENNIIDYNGDKFSRQHEVPPHVLNLMERIQKFVGEPAKLVSRPTEAQYGTYENQKGYRIHVANVSGSRDKSVILTEFSGHHVKNLHN